MHDGVSPVTHLQLQSKVGVVHWNERIDVAGLVQGRVSNTMFAVVQWNESRTVCGVLQNLALGRPDDSSNVL